MEKKTEISRKIEKQGQKKVKLKKEKARERKKV